jgi:hypothetical protein
MAEILTESFCERCGTRYTFEPVDNRRKRLSAISTLGRGIRHFVSDPSTSLDEAFAVARSETEQRSTSSALEAFHRTFNFCLSCRQYTCADCWNTVEGRCLSCSPTPDAAPPETRVDTPVLLAPVDQAPATAPSRPDLFVTEAPETAAHVPDLDETDVAARTAAEAAAAEAEAEAAATQAAEAEADAAAQAAAAEDESRAAAEAKAAEEAESRAAADAKVAAEAKAAELAAAAEDEARAAEAVLAAAAAAEVAAEATARATEASAPSLVFEPGRNLDDEIAEYERQRAEAEVAEPTAGAEPAAPESPEATAAEGMPESPEAAEAEAAPEVEPVGESLAQAAEPEPIPLEPEPTPTAAEPIPTAVGRPLPASVVQGPLSWPDPDVAAAPFEPHWPNIPAARGRSRLQPAVPAQLPAAARACPSCGLSLSASARFCRRCGTPQHTDAAR